MSGGGGGGGGGAFWVKSRLFVILDVLQNLAEYSNVSQGFPMFYSLVSFFFSTQISVEIKAQCSYQSIKTHT